VTQIETRRRQEGDGRKREKIKSRGHFFEAGFADAAFDVGLAADEAAYIELSTEEKNVSGGYEPCAYLPVLLQRMSSSTRR